VAGHQWQVVIEMANKGGVLYALRATIDEDHHIESSGVTFVIFVDLFLLINVN